MARFDRYLLSQFLLLFGFYALVLVGVLWINGAVRLFDRLIADGQTATAVLQHTLLSLPVVVGRVLPVAAFAAVVHVLNRLSTDSEVLILRAAGISPWRLVRPVLAFGVIVAAGAAVVAHLLLPQARLDLAERQQALTRDVTARLLSEGTFLHPVEGVTFYISRIDPDGTLNDVFLSDRRRGDRAEVFTAGRAYLVNTAEADATPRPTLVMLDGLGQSLSHSTGRLITTRFDDVSFDLTQLLRSVSGIDASAAFLSTGALMADPDGVAARTGDSLGRVLEELNGRFRDPALCLAAVLVAFGAMLFVGLNRFGAWRQIGLAVVALVAIKLVENLSVDAVLARPALWPLLYAPVGFGVVLATLMMAWAGRAGGRRGVS